MENIYSEPFDDLLYAFMYDCTNKGSHSLAKGEQKTIPGDIGGIAFALYPLKLYCCKASV